MKWGPLAVELKSLISGLSASVEVVPQRIAGNLQRKYETIRMVRIFGIGTKRRSK